MYRTGDAARWWPDGNMELLGRLDDQVKVRGYRIELGEIEQTLRTHPGVGDTAVIVRRNDLGENQLIAYMVHGDQGEVSYDSLRSHLQRPLPDYMIPGSFVAINALPLTSNGKLDRRALLKAQHCPILPKRSHVPPSGAKEIARWYFYACLTDQYGRI